nr:DUF438 domain-containing protein [Paenibacillus forsythiae]
MIRQVSEVLDKSRRREMLKEVVKELHAGKSVDEVKDRFEKAVAGINVSEIAAMENALINEEGVPAAEIRRLCAVHEAVFQGTIKEIHRFSKPEDQPGHPAHTFKRENRDVERLVNFKLKLHAGKFQKNDSPDNARKLQDDLALLFDLDKHYRRKEELLFPYLEKHGGYGPSGMMWGEDDSIRSMIKNARAMLMPYRGCKAEVGEALSRIILEINQMICKEEQVLLPAALEKLTEEEWLEIAKKSAEIGYCLSVPEEEWVPEHKTDEPAAAGPDSHSVMNSPQGYVRFGTGTLAVEQLELILNHLPVDLTFIDENDVIRYFSHGKDRLFTPSGAVLGCQVRDCHPPQGEAAIGKLLDDFKAGCKESEEFWIHIRDQFIHIRYFAVRDDRGRYMGALEFTQNIAPLRALEGQKRALAESYRAME